MNNVQIVYNLGRYLTMDQIMTKCNGKYSAWVVTCNKINLSNGLW